jgi:hypothetical protein
MSKKRDVLVRPEGWVQQFPNEPERIPAQTDPVPWIRCMEWGFVCRCGSVVLLAISDYESLCETCGGNRLRIEISIPMGWYKKHLSCRTSP